MSLLRWERDVSHLMKISHVHLVYYVQGSEDLDQVIKVLFGTASFTGGFIGFLLDNIVPGKCSLNFHSLMHTHLICIEIIKSLYYIPK